jgi:hypothetical protein
MLMISGGLAHDNDPAAPPPGGARIHATLTENLTKSRYIYTMITQLK